MRLFACLRIPFIPLIALLPVLVIACKAPSYSYVPPALNNTAYSKAGEAHLAAQVGTAFAVRAGYALTQNINVNAWYGGLPADSGYKSSEGEFSIGYQTTPDNNNVVNFYLGVGSGRNKKITAEQTGHFTRPFFQVQYGGYDKGRGKFDGYVGVRINYLDYNGKKEGVDFDDNIFYYEPYYGMAVGGKNVRFQITQGFSIKNASDWGKGARVFPFFINFGVLVKIRKE